MPRKTLDMPQDFSIADARPADGGGKIRVLVTGAAGRIGSYFAEHNRDRYTLRLMVRPGDNTDKIAGLGEVVKADLSDLAALGRAMTDINVVVHMAGDPNPSATWNDLLQTNIIGTYNTLIAAKAAGVRRVIYASSIHAVSGYPADVQVKTNEPVNPGDVYGVSKCFGEAMGRYMAEQEGLSVICLRIGGFQPPENLQKESGLHMLDAWVSHRDLDQLIRKCVDVQNLKFAIFHGLSNNRFKRLDISTARELVGYEPQDDATEVNEKVKDLHLAEQLSTHSQHDGAQKSGIREEVAALTGKS